MSSNPSENNRPSVLCIDDSQLVRMMIQRLLGSQVELLNAASAQSGLEMARTRKPRLIITDINMPGMNGYELLRTLKGDPQTAHIPVLALTSAASPEQVQHGKEAGFDDYVVKRGDMSLLMRTVAQYLHQREGFVS